MNYKSISSMIGRCIASRKARIKILFIVTVIISIKLFAAQTNGSFVYSRQGILSKTGKAPAFDCTLGSPEKQIAPPEAITLFRLGKDIGLPKESKAFTAAVWSPDSEAIAFVSPTERIRLLSRKSPDSKESDRSIPLAVSINEIWYYQVKKQAWHLVSSNGSSPIFSQDGNKLYFLSDSRLIAFDTRSFSQKLTSLVAGHTPSSTLLSQPLPDGSLFTLASDSPYFYINNEAKRDPRRFELEDSDRISFSPDGMTLAISYAGYGKTSPVTVAFGNGSSPVTLFRNCPYSATELAWSADGGAIAYPVAVSSSTSIHRFDFSTSTHQTLLLPTNERVSSLSFSPNGRYILFSEGGSGSTKGTINVMLSDGRGIQVLGYGLMPKWSPNGNFILYVSTQDGAWHLLNVEEAR